MYCTCLCQEVCQTRRVKQIAGSTGGFTTLCVRKTDQFHNGWTIADACRCQTVHLRKSVGKRWLGSGWGAVLMRHTMCLCVPSASKEPFTALSGMQNVIDYRESHLGENNCDEICHLCYGSCTPMIKKRHSSFNYFFLPSYTSIKTICSLSTHF